jgi:hypothetical protein
MTGKTEETAKAKSTGGIASFGYAWRDSTLVLVEFEAQIRKLIYELFLKHRRKKTVAKLLNDLGYRTRSGALFSDTTVDRLLRDTTAKGIKIVDGKEMPVEPIVSVVIWQRANNLLGQKATKPPVHLFAGFAHCDCGGKMLVPSSTDKYVCPECRHKINTNDLEEIFVSQLDKIHIGLENNTQVNLSDYWLDFTSKEKRIIVEQICDKISVGKSEITIEFVFSPNSLKTAAFEQQSREGNETPISEETLSNQPVLNEPLMNERDAAKFLGISRMTLLRKRNARKIGFFRVGFRVLYSKEKHLLPFLRTCER